MPPHRAWGCRSATPSRPSYPRRRCSPRQRRFRCRQSQRQDNVLRQGRPRRRSSHTQAVLPPYGHRRCVRLTRSSSQRRRQCRGGRGTRSRRTSRTRAGRRSTRGPRRREGMDGYHAERRGQCRGQHDDKHHGGGACRHPPYDNSGSPERSCALAFMARGLGLVWCPRSVRRDCHAREVLACSEPPHRTPNRLGFTPLRIDRIDAQRNFEFGRQQRMNALICHPSSSRRSSTQWPLRRCESCTTRA
jgi:hypothetical protein